jgi:predicted ATPase
LDLDYYQRIPSLTTSNTTNWLLADAPHVYLYTSLLHATPFLMDDARYQVFQNTVSQQVMASVKSQQTLSLDDVKSAGFSLATPSDLAAAAMDAKAAVSNAANNM